MGPEEEGVVVHIIEDDEGIRRALERFLNDPSYELGRSATTFEEAMGLIGQVEREIREGDRRERVFLLDANLKRGAVAGLEGRVISHKLRMMRNELKSSGISAVIGIIGIALNEMEMGAEVDGNFTKREMSSSIDKPNPGGDLLVLISSVLEEISSGTR